MGDRTRMWINVHRRNEPQIIEQFGIPDEGDIDDDNIVYMVYYDANYGGYDGLDKLAQKGIDYYAGWDPGADYDAGKSVSMDGVQVDVLASAVDATIYCMIDPNTMKPDPASLADCILFLTNVKELLRRWKEK